MVLKLDTISTLKPLQPAINDTVINYEEKIVKWNPVCNKSNALFYQFTTKENTNQIELIPDACLDIIFSCDNSPEATIIGPKTKKTVLEVRENTNYFCIKPYSMQGVKTDIIDWKNLFDEEKVNKCDFNNMECLSSINNMTTFEDRINFFLDFAKRELIDYDYKTDFTEYSEIVICNLLGNVKIKELCNHMGYTDRYCRKLFKEKHQISLKEYSKIMRFQNSIRIMENNQDMKYSEISAETGYYDQAHYIKEFKEYLNCTPSQYKEAHF